MDPSRNRLVLSKAYQKNLFRFACMATHVSKYIYFLKWSNIHERWGMCWIERKINFPISVFRVMVIFVLKSPQFSMNFHDISKNKNRKINVISFFILFSKFRTFHKNPTISEGSKTPHFRWLVCISLVGTGPLLLLE